MRIKKYGQQDEAPHTRFDRNRDPNETSGNQIRKRKQNFGMFYLTLHVLAVTSHISWLQPSMLQIAIREREEDQMRPDIENKPKPLSRITGK